MLIRFRIPLIVGLLFLGGFFSSLGQPATYYVATSGNDSASGSQSAPFRTISKGLSVLTSGGTLNIGPGTYNEGISGSDSNAIPSGSNLARTIIQGSGAILTSEVNVYSRSYVTIRGITVYGAIIRLGRASTSDQLSLYINLENVTVDHCPNNGAAGLMAGFRQEQNSCFFNITNCRSVNNGTLPDTHSPREHGIYVSGRDITVNGGEYANNTGHGIHVYSTSGVGATNNCTVQNVSAHHNGSFGIGLYEGLNLKAFNNQIFSNGQGISGSGGIRVAYGSSGAQVNGNTIHDNNYQQLMVDSGIQGAVIQNNNICGTNPIVDNGSGTVKSNNSCNGTTIPPPGNVIIATNPPVTTSPPQQEPPTPAPSGGGSSIPVAGIIGAGVLIAVLMSD